MAGEYGVNIKFRAIGLSQIDKATAKAKELENSVSKIVNFFSVLQPYLHNLQIKVVFV